MHVQAELSLAGEAELVVAEYLNRCCILQARSAVTCAAGETLLVRILAVLAFHVLSDAMFCLQLLSDLE